jgi:hypothetical protein
MRTPNLGENSNVLYSSRNDNLVEAKPMEHAINQLREELIKMIRAETMDFRSALEVLKSHSEKLD